jgi:hypothetical protein
LGKELPRVSIGKVEAHLFDVSLSGIACQLSDSSVAPEAGTIVPVKIWVRDRQAFSGSAEVVRSQREPKALKLGLRFIDSLLAPSVLQGLGQDAAFQDALNEGAQVYSSVPEGYRRALSDAVVVLSHWRELLRGRESEIIASDVEDRATALTDLERIAVQRVRRDWLLVHAAANKEIALAYRSRESLLAAKKLTELLITPILMGAPIWQRAYRKPRGYPGDFELMNFMYDDQALGDSVFDRVMHQLGREERLAATVRDRRDYLVRQIQEAVSQGSAEGQAQIRISSIGAGPAREIEDFLAHHELETGLVISLIDQDDAALEFAHERIRRVALRHGGRVALRCRHVSFKQLLTHLELIEEVREQDLIYSAGLFDYLPEVVAQVLLTRLFEFLRPDGRILVGNAVDDDGVKWVPEFVLDWRLIYRTPAEMLRLAEGVGERGKFEIQHDSSQAWQFLVGRRR